MLSIRLFLSSTFLDFTWERSVINTELVPALKQELGDLGVHFDVVDLRWGVTQASGIDQSTVSICLDEVRRCCTDGAQPSFMLMVGDRSGWCPLPRLITEDVFQTVHAHMATLNPQTATLFAQWYLADDNFLTPTRQLRERWGLAETPAEWAQVEHQLRQAVLQLVPQLAPPTVALFDTPITEMEADLALQLEQEFPGRSVALRRLPSVVESDAVQQRLNALWTKVQGCIGGRAEIYQCTSPSGGLNDTEYQAFFKSWFYNIVMREVAAAQVASESSVSANGYLPFLDSTFARGLPSSVPREVEQEVDRWVQQAQPCGSERPHSNWVKLLFGRSGSGKSSVIRRLHARQSQAMTAVMLGDSKTRLVPELTLVELERWLRLPTWAQASHGVGTMLSVDALDAVNWDDASEALSWIPIKAPGENAGLRLLLTTASTDIRDAFASLFGEDAIWTLDEMTDAEASQALQSDLASVGRRLQDFQEMALIESTHDADGRALLIRIAGRITRSLHSSANPQLAGANASSWLKQWRRQLIDQLHYGAPVVDAVLATVCVARAPVPERLLFELVSTDAASLNWLASAFPEQTNSFPRVLFARLLADIEGVLDREMHDGEWSLRFSHALINKSLRAALEPASLEQARQRLADHAMQHFTSGHTVGQWEHNEVLQLLANCQPPRLEELEYLLTQPKFIAFKFSPGLIADTLADMSLLRQQACLGSTVLEDVVAIVGYRWSHLSALGSESERLEWVWQILRELPGSSTLRKRALVSAPADRGLVPRLPAARLPGLTWLNMDSSRRATAILAGTDLVFEVEDGSLVVLDTEFGRIKRRLPGHGGKLCGAVVVDGNRLLSSGGDAQVALSSISAGRDIVRFKAGTAELEYARPTPDGGVVASCLAEKTLYRWDAQGRLVGQLLAVEQDVPCFVIREDCIEARTRVRPLEAFFPMAPSILKAFASAAADLLVLDNDRVLLLSMAGLAIWSFAQGRPLLVIDQDSNNSFAPKQVLLCQSSPTLCILILTLAGSVFRVDLDTGEVEVLQVAGILPAFSPRGNYGGVSPVSDAYVLSWSMRSEEQIDTLLIERATGVVINSSQVIGENLPQSEYFRGGLSNVPRGILMFDDQKLLAWSGYGIEIVDLELGRIIPVMRWGPERYTTFVHLVDATHVLLYQGNRLLLLDFINSQLLADLTDWFGEISELRVLNAHTLLISDKDANVALWHLPETLAARLDLEKWSNLCSQPMGIRKALLMDQDRIVVQKAATYDSGDEFWLWHAGSEGGQFQSRAKSHSTVGADAGDRIAPSGWLVEGNLLISWGRNGFIRYISAEGDELSKITFDSVSGIEHCIPLHGEEGDPEALPALLISSRNQLFLVKPVQRIAIPVPFKPEPDESFLSAWSTCCGVRLLTSQNLMELVVSPIEDPTLTPCLSVREVCGERARFSADSTILELSDSTALAWLGVEIMADGTDVTAQRNIASRHALGFVFDDAFKVQAAQSWSGVSLVSEMKRGLLLRRADGELFNLFVNQMQVEGSNSTSPEFLEQQATVLQVHPRFPLQGRQTISPIDGLTFVMEGPVAKSELRLLVDRIVYACPEGLSTWYAPEGYSVLDASDDSSRLLIGLNNGSAQVIDVVSSLQGQQGAKVTSIVRNAEWMMQLGGAEPAAKLLSATLQGIPSGHEKILCALAFCDAVLMAGDIKRGASLLRSFQFSDTEENLNSDDLQNKLLYRKHRQVAYRMSLLTLADVTELKQFLGLVVSGSAPQCLRQLQSLLKVSTSMAVTGSPLLEKLILVHEFIHSLLQDRNSSLYKQIVLPFAAYSYTLQKVVQNSENAVTVQQEDWYEHVPVDQHAELALALAGDGEASNRLGILFALGNQGVTRSLTFARYWYLKGAEQGNTQAAMNAAQMLRSGQGGEVDLHRCMNLLQMCAEAGIISAACNLGAMLMNEQGPGLEPDYEKARYWLELALGWGDEIASINLALMYAMGLGVKKNIQRAMELLSPVLSKGDERAIRLLERIQSTEQK